AVGRRLAIRRRGCSKIRHSGGPEWLFERLDVGPNDGYSLSEPRFSRFRSSPLNLIHSDASSKALEKVQRLVPGGNRMMSLRCHKSSQQVKTVCYERNSLR